VLAFGKRDISRHGLGMGTIERDSGLDKLQKTAKELEDMLRCALQQQHGAIIDDLKIRVFRTKAGPLVLSIIRAAHQCSLTAVRLTAHTCVASRW